MSGQAKASRPSIISQASQTQPSTTTTTTTTTTRPINEMIIEVQDQFIEMQQNMQNDMANLQRKILDIQMSLSKSSDSTTTNNINRDGTKTETQTDSNDGETATSSNTTKRTRQSTFEPIKREYDGTFKKAKMLEAGRCKFPPNDQNTPKARQDRLRLFRSIVKRYTEYELNSRRRSVRRQHQKEDDTATATTRPHVAYTMSKFTILKNAHSNFTWRAYCSARYKQQCPVTLILQYEWSTRMYKFFRVCKHNHRLEAGVSGGGNEVDEDAAASEDEVEVLVSKFSQGVNASKIKIEKN